jgi:stage II sporulation protein D
LLASALVLTGAAPGKLRAQQANPQVRVLLLETAKLTLASPQQPLVLRAGSQRWSLAPLEPVVLQLAAGSLVLERAAGVERLPAVRELWLEPAAQSAGAPLNLQYSPQEGADFQLQQRGYRGRLQVLVGSSSLQAVNHVALEAYLPSVVASEMPASTCAIRITCS